MDLGHIYTLGIGTQEFTSRSISVRKNECKKVGQEAFIICKTNNEMLYHYAPNLVINGRESAHNQGNQPNNGAIFGPIFLIAQKRAALLANHGLHCTSRRSHSLAGRRPPASNIACSALAACVEGKTPKRTISSSIQRMP